MNTSSTHSGRWFNLVNVYIYISTHKWYLKFSRPVYLTHYRRLIDNINCRNVASTLKTSMGKSPWQWRRGNIASTTYLSVPGAGVCGAGGRQRPRLLWRRSAVVCRWRPPCYMYLWVLWWLVRWRAGPRRRRAVPHCVLYNYTYARKKFWLHHPPLPPPFLPRRSPLRPPSPRNCDASAAQTETLQSLCSITLVKIQV